MARLEINSVSKTFGRICCADDLSLSVEAGEIVALFGPSGSGKTVLLRMIAGMFEPDRGDILIGGNSVVGAPPERRGIGMAFQNFALFPHLSARENIASSVRKKGVDAASRVRSMSRLLKIEHVLGHRPRELSNGQKQRTALARALIGDPEVLLLDDPLRNVDAKLRYEMRLELPGLLRRSSASVLYVTQDYREAMAIADRIAVLIGGRLEQLATPEEIYSRPASVAVARLFGDPSINLSEIVPVVDHGRLVAEISGHRVRLNRSDEPSADYGPCWLGVRPDDLMISASSCDGAIGARIVAVTPMHEKAVLLLRFSDGCEWLAAQPANTALSAEQNVFVSFAPESALLFDWATGRHLGPPRRRQAA
jgi:multiple sugar transport system ATP-binding protein